MVILIFGVILAVVIAMGLIMALMVRKKEKDYHIFFKTGMIVVIASMVLMVVSFIFQIPFYIHLPLFALGLIYLIIGLTNRNKWRKTE